MILSTDLLKAFAKTTNDTKTETKKESTSYGIVTSIGDKQYVKLDGSDLLTPVVSTSNNKDGERVIVAVKDHSAIVTGNISMPSARTDDVNALGNKINAQGNTITLMDNTITSINNTIVEMNNTVNSQNNKIDQVNNKINQHDNVINQQGNTITQISSTINQQSSTIETINSSISTINSTLEAQGSSITANNSSIQVLNSAFTIADGKVTGLSEIILDKLDTTYLNAESADIKYANIDFSNIKMAAVEELFSKSGIIKDLVVGDTSITGELVGVTIKGDLIEGNTVVADKLVVKGEDGLYYKLNTTGTSIEAEQTDYNSLNGSIITAKSITATKIAVDDLVAFDATIGGFKITEDSIYSGVKNAVNNTTRGIYLDKAGQMAIGDAENYIMYYKATDGSYKLAIAAKSVTIGSSGMSVEDAIGKVQDDLDTMNGEITTNLRIESSRGTVFKHNEVSTVLSAVIYRGSRRITDMVKLKEIYGDSAYLQWSWQKMNEEEFGNILSTDSRLSNDGFSFTLSPEDVDTKVTFMCQLITD